MIKAGPGLSHSDAGGRGISLRMLSSPGLKFTGLLMVWPSCVRN